jgi:hypothetical protein
MTTSIADSEYLLITDGEQFRRPFWDREAKSLTKLMDKQRVRHPTYHVPTVPEPEELQMQFIQWVLERPTIPMLVAPANSGFYDEVYRAIPPTQHNTGFFDDEYVDGRRNCSPAHEMLALNPASRAPSPTYQEVNTAVLTTTDEIEHHETRIYQKGYTPSEIRNKITRLVRESNPDQPILDFQEKDIPPINRDAHTYRMLTDLLQQRNRMDEDFHLPPDAVAKDGTSLLNPRTYEAEYLQRDKEYNRLNRSMYHIYAASAYVIHDNNFLSYCRPALRNLPVATAFKLATLKLSLQTPPEDQPPYQTITRPTTV